MPADIFDTTRWSLVVTARDRSSTAARQAFDGLARMYWKPLYTYVRRRGHSIEESEDLVQGFFAKFIENEYLDNVDADKGRFRAFLLVCIKRYMADEYDKAMAQKRGGGAHHIAMDTVLAESTILARVDSLSSPEAAFDRAWAITVLDEALDRLARDYEPDEFNVLKPRLTGSDEPSYSHIAQSLDITELAARKRVQRLRQQYKQAVRSVIRDSLKLESDIDNELTILFDALG